METSQIVKEIYEVFQDYYSEDLVDLQITSEADIDNFNLLYNNRGSTIYSLLINWPEVTITNEYDNSIVIWGLWCKLFINNTGKLLVNPTFTRSEYNHFQWNGAYVHSHIPSLDYRDFKAFRYSCLGSGPLSRHTTDLRQSQYYTDLDIWRLFAWELDKYVHVESLIGVPYRRLSEVGNSNSRSNNHIVGDIMEYPYGYHSISNYCIELVSKFIDYIIEHKVIRFAYYNNKYSLGENTEDTYIKLSKAFIDMYNNDPNIYNTYSKRTIIQKLFMPVFSSQGRFYTEVDLTSGKVLLEEVVGTELFTFKGSPVVLKALDTEEVTDNSIYILHTSIVGYIIYKLLLYLNIYYNGTTNKISKEYKII